MNIKQIEFESYLLKFRAPLETSRIAIKEKEILIIKLKDEFGHTAKGECAPMPWFGTETLDDIKSQIENLTDKKGALFFDEDLSAIETKLDELDLLPTLRFGLEQALFKLSIKINNSFQDEFKINNTKRLNVSAVSNLFSDDDKIFKILDSGINTIKFKLGANNFSDEIAQIKYLASRFRDRIKIRLDVNGGWNLEQASSAMDQLIELPIEYLEQPVIGLKELALLAELNLIPIAADESILNLKDADFITNSTSVKYLVVKPMFIGGFGPFRYLYRQAERKGKRIIVSSAFESSIGRSHNLLCAADLNSGDAHGLDTAGYISNDVEPDPFPVVNGSINFGLDNYFGL